MQVFLSRIETFVLPLHIITGHAKAGAELSIDFDAFSQARRHLDFHDERVYCGKNCSGLDGCGYGGNDALRSD